jgi:hypothetical protein
VAWFYEYESCEGPSVELPPGAYSFGAEEPSPYDMEVSCVFVESGCYAVLYTAGGSASKVVTQANSFLPLGATFNNLVASVFVSCGSLPPSPPPPPPAGEQPTNPDTTPPPSCPSLPSSLLLS